MFNNAALDVVIGLVFIYLLYSLLATVVVEIIATNIGMRGWLLQKAIERMLDDNATSQKKANPIIEDVAWLKIVEKEKEKTEKIIADEKAKREKEETEEDKKERKDREAAEKVKKDMEPFYKVSTAFFVHPLIKYLRADTLFIKKKPSYIDPETFTKVLIDLLRGPEAKVGGSDRHLIQKTLEEQRIPWKVAGDKLVGGKYLTDKHKKHYHAKLEEDTCIYLESVWVDSQGDVTKFKAYIVDWYNEMMERTTGWYKKYTQLMLVVIGLVIAGSFNVDTIKIAKLLQAKPELRKQMIDQVDAFTKANPNFGKSLDSLQKQLNRIPVTASTDSISKQNQKKRDFLEQQINKSSTKKLQEQQIKLIENYLPDATHSLGMGYEGGFWINVNWCTIPGWLITALAISMGAPFWFDLLNKLMQLRTSLAPKDDAKDKSKTNQTPKVIKIDG